MRLLFLSRWFPYPANNGAKVRAFNIISQLARAHQVTLATFSDEHTSAAHVAEMRRICARVEHVPYREFKPSSVRSVVGLVASKPRSAVDTYSPAFESLTRRMAAEDRPDAIVASGLDMAPYPLAVPGVPRVLEELETSTFRRQYLEEPRPLARLRKQMMWMKWRGYIRAMLKHYVACMTVSQPEADLIHGIYPSYRNMRVVKNGADLARLTGRFADPQPDTLAYTGALTYYVNYDAMRRFIGEVLPLIVARRPSVRLRMAGRLDGVDIAALPKHPNAEHCGHMDDIRPFVQSAWLSVVPEVLGGGTRIKVLESLALGTPVVANANSLRGLELRHERDVLQAETAAEQADAVLQLLDNVALRRNLIANGRNAIERIYDWNVIGDDMNAFIADALGWPAR